MTSNLSALLAAARRRAVNPKEVPAQRRSFAFGNGNIGQDNFSRATMSMIVQPRHDSGETDAGATTSAGPEAYHHNVEGALRQVDVAIDLIRRFTEQGAPPFKLVPEIILDLHDALRDRGVRGEGGFRKGDVRIGDSELGPVEPDRIAAEVDALCEEVNSSWQDDDALELAAFVLWRLNWIHPFSDGNGRTARALSYVVLSIKLGALLPGAPTIPEQLLHQRAEYLDALADIDRTVTAGAPNLRSLRRLLEQMLERQLTALPALSSNETNEVDDVIARRLSGVRRGSVSSVFGHGPVAHRLWSLDDHLVLQVGPQAAIDEAEHRYLELAQPFPRLLAGPEDSANRIVSADQRGIIIRDRRLAVKQGSALLFKANAAATIEHPNVQWYTGTERDGWSAIGALYVLRFGPDLTSAWAAETIDLLMARHIADLNP